MAGLHDTDGFVFCETTIPENENQKPVSVADCWFLIGRWIVGAFLSCSTFFFPFRSPPSFFGLLFLFFESPYLINDPFHQVKKVTMTNPEQQQQQQQQKENKRRTRTGVVRYVGRRVEEAVDAVAAVAAHHREAVRLRVFLDHRADVAVPHARFHCSKNTQNKQKSPHRIIHHAVQSTSVFLRFT